MRSTSRCRAHTRNACSSGESSAHVSWGEPLLERESWRLTASDPSCWRLQDSWSSPPTRCLHVSMFPHVLGVFVWSGMHDDTSRDLVVRTTMMFSRSKGFIRVDCGIWCTSVDILVSASVSYLPYAVHGPSCCEKNWCRFFGNCCSHEVFSAADCFVSKDARMHKCFHNTRTFLIVKVTSS